MLEADYNKLIKLLIKVNLSPLEEIKRDKLLKIAEQEIEKISA